MPSRNDRSSERAGAGGESQQEPLVDRQLELDVLRQHIARVAETGKGHAVLILGEPWKNRPTSPSSTAFPANRR
jgi:hypothetical protein